MYIFNIRTDFLYNTSASISLTRATSSKGMSLKRTKSDLFSDDYDGSEVEVETIKLISQDGFEFIIEKDAALGSNTIKSMISAKLGFSESLTNEIHFSEIRGIILDKVCQYLCYKYKYETTNSIDLPEFVIPPEITLEVLLAADYLQC